MKNINVNKIAGATHAILFLISAIWFASLAIRGYCSWGLNGFAGYTILSYLFFAVTNGFLQNALSVEADTNSEENVEEREVDIDTDMPGHWVEVTESNEF